ncbi:MAG: putative metal-binding motif-containing protein [Elusimicrobia bacterium]|nr:putative metal-binding motif-containing protein [Elusimicrobiota bacterium]
MNCFAILLTTILATSATLVRAAETVNWSVTVTAQEELTTQQWQSFNVTVPLTGSGGVRNYVPPANTSRLDIAVAFPNLTVCENCGESFSSIPLGYPYYAVWYTYLGNDTHKLQVYGGNVGGALLRESIFQRYCPNGYRQMNVMFDALVDATVQYPRSAQAGGTLSGGQGEVLSAAWLAAPQPQSGGTLTQFTAAVAGDNPKVELNLAVNGDHVSGSVNAKFPSCVPAPELCDGVDNDCDGAVDEDQGMTQCGVGACATAAPACVDGKAGTCAPLPASAETCDGIDNDCDGVADDGLGSVSCGTGACANSVPACMGGTAQACTPLPSTSEKCDGFDNDCDGSVDEGCPQGILNILERFTDGTLPSGIQKFIDRINGRVSAGMSATPRQEARVERINDRLDKKAAKNP